MWWSDPTTNLKKIITIVSKLPPKKIEWEGTLLVFTILLIPKPKTDNTKQYYTPVLFHDQEKSRKGKI